MVGLVCWSGCKLPSQLTSDHLTQARATLRPLRPSGRSPKQCCNLCIHLFSLRVLHESAHKVTLFQERKKTCAKFRWKTRHCPRADFFMFPTFLALSSNHPTSATSSYCPAIEIIHAMSAFVTSTDEARKRSQLASGALIYACQHWAIHLSQAQNPWNKTLDHEFNHFWENYLSSWLELQWHLSGLQSCLTVLSQMLVKQVSIYLIIFATYGLTCSLEG